MLSFLKVMVERKMLAALLEPLHMPAYDVSGVPVETWKNILKLNVKFIKRDGPPRGPKVCHALTTRSTLLAKTRSWMEETAVPQSLVTVFEYWDLWSVIN